MTTPAALVRAAVPLFEALRTRKLDGAKHLPDCRAGLWLGDCSPAPCGGRCKAQADWLAQAQAYAAIAEAAPTPQQHTLFEEHAS